MKPFPLPEDGVHSSILPFSYSEADASGLLRLTSLLDALQKAADNHTSSVGSSYRENRDAGVFWVISRLTVEITAWPRWPEDLLIHTWARGTKALLALRDYRFGTGELGVCGRATTAWVLLKDKRPQRLEPWIQIYRQVSPEEPVAAFPGPLPLDACPETEKNLIFRAGWNDIDMNDHVNNVSAVGWCLRLHDFAFLKHWRPAFLEAQFLAEMLPDEEFSLASCLVSQDADERTYDYFVSRIRDGVTTLRMRIRYSS